MRLILCALFCAITHIQAQGTLHAIAPNFDKTFDKAINAHSLNTLHELLLSLPIASSKAWLALLHIHTSPSIFPPYTPTSSIPKHIPTRSLQHPFEKPFFIHTQGHKNPKQEYLATIKELLQELSTLSTSINHAPNPYPSLATPQKHIQKHTPLEQPLIAYNNNHTSSDAMGHITDSATHDKNNAKYNKQDGAQDKSSDSTHIISYTASFAPPPTYTRDEFSLACVYPARLYLIESYVNKYALTHPHNPSYTTLARLLEAYRLSKQCAHLEEFLRLVPLDDIWLEFAAESAIYPESSMGHVFLRLQGASKHDIDEVIEGTPIKRAKGELVEYGMSYYAMLSDIFNPMDYLRAIMGNLHGYYALSPYDTLTSRYLDEEHRSLYHFKLASTEQGRKLFLLHIWELRGKQIYYDFMTHNCTNGIADILAVLDDAYYPRYIKPFITPSAYVRYLHAQGAIIKQSISYPPQKQRFFNTFGANDVLHAYPHSHIALTYGSNNRALLAFMPLYANRTSADSSYKELLESKLMEFEIGLTTHSASTHAFISQITILQAMSLPDVFRTHEASKFITLRAESNYYDFQGAHFLAQANTQTRLFPTFELGFGGSAYTRFLTFYALPILGYRYEIIHNPYLALKVGMLATFPYVLNSAHMIKSGLKAMLEAQVFYDVIGNNRGYDARIDGSLHIGIFANAHIALDAVMQTQWLWNLAQSPITYQASTAWNLTSGLSMYF